MKFNKNVFESLAAFKSDKNNLITILIPTDRIGDGQAAKIRFKNQLDEAMQLLTEGVVPEHPMTKVEALKYLALPYALLDNDDFWIHQSDGLAAFIGPDKFDYYSLPIDFQATTYINNHFYLFPTLEAITGKKRFFLLALSQNEVRFFEGNKYSITPVIINDLVPANLEATQVGEVYPSELQAHSGGGNQAIYHGHGGNSDKKLNQLENYFRQVDKGLMEMLHDEQAPLVIAAVDYLVPIYKNISNYAAIVDASIDGNPENDDPVLLHEKAWPLIQSIVDKQVDEEKGTFKEALNKGRASEQLTEIIPAAKNGKVDTLFISKDAQPLWGTHQVSTNSIALHTAQQKESSCLINAAALDVFLQGGKVVLEEDFPATDMAQAIYRY